MPSSKINSVTLTVEFEKSQYAGNVDCESEIISFQGVALKIKLIPKLQDHAVEPMHEKLVAFLFAKCSSNVNVDIMFGIKLWAPEVETCFNRIFSELSHLPATDNLDRAIVSTEFLQPGSDRYSNVIKDGKLSFVIQLTFKKHGDCSATWNDTIPTTLFDQTTSDFAITVESVRIPCHKLILSLASPVFKAMFESQMQESVTNEIVISDFSEEVVRSFLKCIYDPSAAFSELESSFAFAQNLLHISIKYQAKDMMDQATNFIVQNIDADTVLDILTFAEQFDIRSIKDEALHFMVKNAKLFLKRPDILKTLHLDLVSEFLSLLADSY